MRKTLVVTTMMVTLVCFVAADYAFAKG